NGYWAYSPGFGYAWVSAYPWGWLPFRYGHWVFVNGRGWCWAPGEWNRWHTGPRWGNALPGFRPPVRPAAAPTGTVTRAPGFGGAGVRGPVAKPDDRDRNRDNSAQAGGNRSNRRTFTNEDVQSRTPRVEVPPPAGPAQVERKPAVVDQRQQPAGGSGIHRGDESRFRGDRETVPVPPVGRAIDKAPAAVTTATAPSPPGPAKKPAAAVLSAPPSPAGAPTPPPTTVPAPAEPAAGACSAATGAASASIASASTGARATVGVA